MLLVLVAHTLFLAQAMAESEEDVMDMPQRVKLRILVREGPFAVDVEAGVQLATES